MGFLLAFAGALLILLSLAGVALGLFMALGRAREPGIYFALWWTPAVAAAAGILMRDPPTFAIGAFCFVVAGAAFVLERRSARRRARSKRRSPRDAGEPSSGGGKRRSPEEAEQLSERVKRWFSGRMRSRIVKPARLPRGREGDPEKGT